jgi:hypothetical protein
MRGRQPGLEVRQQVAMSSYLRRVFEKDERIAAELKSDYARTLTNSCSIIAYRFVINNLEQERKLLTP